MRSVLSYFSSSADGSHGEDDQTEQTDQDVGCIDIYTDGSCFNNGSTKKSAPPRAGWAFDVYRDDVLVHTHAGVLPNAHGTPTNQKAELHAILAALEWCVAHGIGAETMVRLYSDSEYSIKCVTEWAPKWSESDWKIKKNTELIRSVMRLMPRVNVSFKHVRAHNEQATDKHSRRNCLVDARAREQTQRV